MNEIYRVTIHGKILESRNLRQLLARAVTEKRTMDSRIRLFARAPDEMWLYPVDHAGYSLYGLSCESSQI